MNTIIIKTEAADRSAGMTLAELEAFVQQVREYQFTGDTLVRASIGFRGQIQWVQVPR